MLPRAKIAADILAPRALPEPKISGHAVPPIYEMGSRAGGAATDEAKKPMVANNAAASNIPMARFAFEWIVGLLGEFIGEFYAASRVRQFSISPRAQLGSRPNERQSADLPERPGQVCA